MNCTRCKVDQPRDQFGPSADMWPEKRQCKACSRDNTSRRKHGLTGAEKAQIAAAQGGCRICGHSEPSSRGWVVDHDHECCPGEQSCAKCRRGVICAYCNTVLGSAFDRPQILLAAIEYLARVRDCSWHVGVECSKQVCDAAH